MCIRTAASGCCSGASSIGRFARSSPAAISSRADSNANMSEGLAETERAAIRAKVFTHLSGVVMVPTVSALWERGALELLTSAPDSVAFDDIVKRTHANAGYLRVALRLLASCGWLVEQPCGSSART